MPPGPFAPFRYREGRLVVEDVVVSELAADLVGQAAWILSRAALRDVFSGPPRCLPVGLVGPLDVLALAAEAGWWTAVLSSHELDLADRAGFPPERIVAPVAWRDDGFVKDALTRGIASLPAVDVADEQNIQRIARLLGVERGAGPPARRAAQPSEVASGETARIPAAVELSALCSCGGLLAPVLRGGEVLVLDALLEGCAPMSSPADRLDVLWVDGRVRCGAAEREITLAGLPGSATQRGESLTLRGRLSGSGRESEARRAETVGETAGPATMAEGPQRGDWVVLPGPAAVACLAPDAAQSRPLHVWVQGGLWRALDQRPLPPAGE